MRPAIEDDINPLGDRDSGVLRVLEEEDLESFSFEGLKRRIGSHPETLSRVLDRLQEKSIIERAEDGYRLTPKGREYLMVHPAANGAERLTILKTLLPPNASLPTILDILKGRWFGNLRWLGYSQGTDLVMKWLTDDGKVQLDARFTPSELTVEARLLHGRELAGAVRAAHNLLAHISASYATPGRRVLMFEAFQTFSAPN